MFFIILEWVATALIIIGCALTAYNIYPLNIFISLLGNFSWIILGVHWKKNSLIVLQVFITIVYLMGLWHVQV